MKDTRPQTALLARKEGLVVQELSGETLVYDLENDRVHCLNETAGFVWQHCDGRTTPSEMARLLGEKVNATVDEAVVWLAIDQLRRFNLLAPLSMTPPTPGFDRRQIMRAMGIAAAVAVPVVTSIVAPKPAQAATCLPPGANCVISTQCCSGLCTAGICA